MKYKISKKKVIEAILAEPLSQGAFFKMPDQWRQKEDARCSVCAVGAILRATKEKEFNSADGETVTKGFYSLSDVSAAWEAGNFLSILSTEFEYADSFEDKHLPRFHALMIAEGMCPKVLKFEV